MFTPTSLIIGAVAGALIGCITQYVIIKFGLKSKFNRIIEEAHKEAEVIKKNKLLEVKEKFLNKKAELEKEISQRNNELTRLLEEKENTLQETLLRCKALENNYNNLKQAKVISLSDAEIGKTRERISRLVREIDHCIESLKK